MASISEDGSEWSDDGIDEDLHRDLSSLREVLADESRPGCRDDGGGIEEEGNRPLEGLKLCLQKNQQLQTLLQQQLDRIQNKLAENRHKQHLLRTLPRSSQRRCFSLSRFTRGLSYFKDHLGKPPPFFSARADKPWNFYIENYWRTDKEDGKLKIGVRDQCILLKSQPLQQRLTETQDPIEQREIRTQISELRHLSDTELMDGVTSRIDWERVAFESFNSSKSGRDCQLRWENCINPALNSQPWSRREDKLLYTLGQKYQYCDWHIVAEEMKTNRNAFACLKRYQQSLNPKMFKSEWTKEEDVFLKTAIAKFGKKNWKAVAHFVGENRTPQQCLHRWNNSVAPGIRKGRWNTAEDEQLREGVRLFGVGNWAKITTLVPSRTSVQCRERWVNVLDDNINRGPWSAEDDQKLFELCSHYTGPIGWSKVATGMGNRTDSMCSQRWKLLSNPGEIVTQYASRMKQREVLMKNFHGRRKHRSLLSSADIEDDLLSQTAKEKLKSYEEKIVKKKQGSSYISRYYAQFGLTQPPVTAGFMLVQRGSPALGVLVEQSSNTTGSMSVEEGQAILQPMPTSTSGSLQLGSTPSSQQLVSTPSGQQLDSTPSGQQLPLGQQLVSTPSGQQLVSTPSGQQLVSTPSGQQLVSTPSGQQLVSTPSGQQLVSTPSGQQLVSTPSGHQLVSTPSSQQCSVKVSTTGATSSRKASKKLRKKVIGRRKRRSSRKWRRQSTSLSSDVGSSDEVCTSTSTSAAPTEASVPGGSGTSGTSNDFAEFPSYRSVIVPLPKSPVVTELSRLPQQRYLYQHHAAIHPPVSVPPQVATTPVVCHAASQTDKLHSASLNPTSSTGSTNASATIYDKANTFLQQYEKGGIINDIAEFPNYRSLIMPQRTSTIPAARSALESKHPPATLSDRSKTFTSAVDSAPSNPMNASCATGASATMNDRAKQQPAEFQNHSMIVPQHTNIIPAVQSALVSGHLPTTSSEMLTSANSAPSNPVSLSGYKRVSDNQLSENDRANTSIQQPTCMVNDLADFPKFRSMIVPQRTFTQLPENRYTHKYPPAFPTTTQTSVPSPSCNASTSTASAAMTLPAATSRLYPHPSPILAPGYPPGYHPMHSFHPTPSAGDGGHHGYPPDSPSSAEHRTGVYSAAMNFSVGDQNPSCLAVTTAYVATGSPESVSHSQHPSDPTAESITPCPKLPEPVLLIDTPTTADSARSVPQSTAESQSTSNMAVESWEIASKTIVDETTSTGAMTVAVSALLELHNGASLEAVDTTMPTLLPAICTQMSSLIDGASAGVRYSMSRMQGTQEASSVTNTIDSCLSSAPHLVSETDRDDTVVGGTVSTTHPLCTTNLDDVAKDNSISAPATNTAQTTRTVSVSVGKSHLVNTSTCHASLSTFPKPVSNVSAVTVSKPVSSRSRNSPAHQRKNGPKVPTEKTRSKRKTPDCGNGLNPRDSALSKKKPEATTRETEEDCYIFKVSRQPVPLQSPESASPTTQSVKGISSCLDLDEVSEASTSNTRKSQTTGQRKGKQKSVGCHIPVGETSQKNQPTAAVRGKHQKSKSRKNLPQEVTSEIGMSDPQQSTTASRSQLNTEPMEGVASHLGVTSEDLPPPQARDKDAETALVEHEITPQRTSKRTVPKEQRGSRSRKRKARTPGVGAKTKTKKRKIA